MSSSLSVAELEEEVSVVECTVDEVIVDFAVLCGGGDVKAVVRGHRRSKNSVFDENFILIGYP